MSSPTPTPNRLACFKAYDIRGRVPGELNDDLAYRIGRAYADEIAPRGPVAVGRDIRASSPGLARALRQGINHAGVDTVDIGLCGTEMIYFAAAMPGMGGGIMVTASHNPIDYNGMKPVRAGAVPISGATGLDAIERRVRENDLRPASDTPGGDTVRDVADDYVKKVLSFVEPGALKPLAILVNPGNGCAGPIVDRLADALPFELVRLHAEPNPDFPNGIPNPLLPENQPATSDAVRRHGCDLGVAWDGDFDRCFFFDENGDFVDGYYIVGLLAKQLLRDHPGAKIIHDPRMTWNTIELVEEAGGVPVASRTGHAFIKEAMRRENAIYGGEMSAHHYFREFFHCDTGMVPWLVLAALMSETGRTLSELVADRKRRFPSSGEINRRVADAAAAIETVRERFAQEATTIGDLDGLSMEFDQTWRFNLRPSQTEPILRLNVESLADEPLMRAKTAEIFALLDD